MNSLGSLSHIALIVKNPERTAEFFRALFDSETRHHIDAEGHNETYVRLGQTWVVLPEAQVDRPLTGDHIAFSVSRDQLNHFAQKLTELGHSYQMARNDTALYFTDYDNHLFELECAGPPFEDKI